MRGPTMPRCMTTRLSWWCGAATGLVLVLAPGAQAAWFGAGSVPGLGFDARVLAGSVPGQVVVTGADSDDAVTGAAHAPGTAAFGSPFAVATTNEPAQVGAGGAVALQQGARPAVRRLGADGTVGAVLALPSTAQATVGAPALAPSGALLVAAADARGNLGLWRQSAEGAELVRIGAVLGHSDEGEATIAASGDDSFVAAFTTSDANQTTVFAVRVTGTTVASPRELDQLKGDPDELSFSALALAPGGQFVVFQSSRQAGEFVRAANVDINNSAKDLAGPFDDDAGVTTPPQAIAMSVGGAAVTWGQTTDGESFVSPYALIADNATLMCSVAEPFTTAALVDRGGPQLVGVVATGTLGTAPVAAGCPAGTVAPGPSVGAAEVVGADVDADGALVVVAGSTDDDTDVSTATIVVNDASPPMLTDLSIPATVNENTPFDVSVSATDPWGVGDVSWSIDNTAVASGARTTLPGVAAGEHTVTATVHNTAGLATSAQAAVTTIAAGSPSPPLAPAPAPVAPPVVGQSSPPQLTLTGLTLDARCVRYGDRRPPQGALGFRFELSETATVTLTIQRRLGSRVRSRCPQDPLPRGTPGQLSKPILTSDLVAGPGPGTVTAGPNGHLIHAAAATTRRARPVARRLPAGRIRLKIRAASTTLTAGTYLATVSAHTTDGRRASAGRIKFWVLK